MVLTFTRRPSPCGHQTIDIAVNGVQTAIIKTHVEEVIATRNAEDRRAALLTLLGLALEGHTRAQAATAFPITVTITEAG